MYIELGVFSKCEEKRFNGRGKYIEKSVCGGEGVYRNLMKTIFIYFMTLIMTALLLMWNLK